MLSHRRVKNFGSDSSRSCGECGKISKSHACEPLGNEIRTRRHFFYLGKMSVAGEDQKKKYVLKKLSVAENRWLGGGGGSHCFLFLIWL